MSHERAVFVVELENCDAFGEGNLKDLAASLHEVAVTHLGDHDLDDVEVKTTLLDEAEAQPGVARLAYARLGSYAESSSDLVNASPKNADILGFALEDSFEDLKTRLAPLFNQPDPPIAKTVHVGPKEISATPEPLFSLVLGEDGSCNEKAFDAPDGAKIVVHTDGSTSHDKFGGWAYVISDGNGTLFGWGAGCMAETTNSRMELQAVAEAMKAIPFGTKFKLYSDSAYVIGGVTQWYKGWQKNGWKKADGNKVKNIDQWHEIVMLVEMHDGSYEHVKGHNGDSMNETCDQMATGQTKWLKSAMTDLGNPNFGGSDEAVAEAMQLIAQKPGATVELKTKYGFAEGVTAVADAAEELAAMAEDEKLMLDKMAAQAKASKGHIWHAGKLQK